MLRLGPTSIRQHMGIPVKCIDADQILNQEIDVLKSFFANIVIPTHTLEVQIIGPVEEVM